MLLEQKADVWKQDGLSQNCSKNTLRQPQTVNRPLFGGPIDESGRDSPLLERLELELKAQNSNSGIPRADLELAVNITYRKHTRPNKDGLLRSPRPTP